MVEAAFDLEVEVRATEFRPGVLDYLECCEGEGTKPFKKLRGDRCITTVRQPLLADEIASADIVEPKSRPRVWYETPQHVVFEVEFKDRIMVRVVLLENLKDEIYEDGPICDVSIPVKKAAGRDPSSDEFKWDHVDLASPKGDGVDSLDKMRRHAIVVE